MNNLFEDILIEESLIRLLLYALPVIVLSLFYLISKWTKKEFLIIKLLKKFIYYILKGLFIILGLEVEANKLSEVFYKNENKK